MKFAIAAAVTLASMSALAFVSPATAQSLIPWDARTNKCGNQKQVCAAARLVHARMGYAVSPLRYCGGQSTGCQNMAGWTYRYWR